MNQFIELDLIDLILALGLIGLAIALSLWQQLELESQLLMSAGRSLLQLLVVGYVLGLVFALNHPFSVLSIIAIMLSIAAIVVHNRIGKQLKPLLPIVWAALFASCALSVSYAIAFILQPPQWYSPQYLIPLVGMILGNIINAASLAGERLASAIQRNRLEIETHLCLGATPKQAIIQYRKDAIRIGLIPLLNQMTVVGLVSLPGMFTGQVLAGSDPINAAGYQILILFMIAFANLFTTISITEGVYRQFFNQKAQLVLPNP